MHTKLLFGLLLFAEAATPQNWRSVEGTEEAAFSIAVNPRNKNSIWFGGFRKIFVSFDGGRTAGRVIENLAGSGVGVITAIFIHPQDTTFILAGSAGCWQSHDNGNTWSHALPDTNFAFNGEAIAFEPLQPDTLYIGVFLNRQDARRIFFRSLNRGATWGSIPIEFNLNNLGFCSLSTGGDGVLLGGTGTRGLILRSTSYGASWTQVYNSSDTTAEVPKITFDKQDVNTVWATLSNFGSEDNGLVLKSTTRGLFWNAISLPGNPWAVETDQQGRVYVGMFGSGFPGVYVSFDDGRTWQNYRTGLPPADHGSGVVWMIKSNGDPFGIFLADGARGAFKLQNFTQVRQSEGTPLPRHFELAQNYPNPFSSKGGAKTVIRYALFASNAVELVIRDLRGETVRTLIHQFETAGLKTAVWDGKDQNGARVSNGVYVYTLRAGQEALSKKLIVAQ
ncbi:MAG: FlgD immunoglobulin-like domain containing protein [bacterium]